MTFRLPALPKPRNIEDFPDEAFATFFEKIEEGMSVHRAAQMSGLGPHRVEDWRFRGNSEEDKQIYRDFEARLIAAQNKNVHDLTLRANMASASGDGTMTRWLLEKTAPEYMDPEKIARIRKIDAEARIAEAKLEHLRKVVEGGGGRASVVTPLDFLEKLDEETRDKVMEQLDDSDYAFTVLRNDIFDVSEKELMEATGLGMGGTPPREDGDDSRQ